MWHVWGKGVIHRGFWWGDPKEVEHLQDLSLDGKIILKWIFKKIERGRIDWLHTAEDGDGWLTLVNAVMNLRVP